MLTILFDPAQNWYVVSKEPSNANPQKACLLEEGAAVQNCEFFYCIWFGCDLCWLSDWTSSCICDMRTSEGLASLLLSPSCPRCPRILIGWCSSLFDWVTSVDSADRQMRLLRRLHSHHHHHQSNASPSCDGWVHSKMRTFCRKASTWSISSQRDLHCCCQTSASVTMKYSSLFLWNITWQAALVFWNPGWGDGENKRSDCIYQDYLYLGLTCYFLSVSLSSSS